MQLSSSINPFGVEIVLKETERINADISASAAPGVSTTSYTNTQIIPTFSGNLGTYGDMIYEGKNVNANAMQLSSSINPFGVEIVLKETETSTGKEKTNESVGKKWIIQPKMETPMLNFNNLGVKPITNAAGNLALPVYSCLLYTSPSPRDRQKSRMPSSA